MDRCGCVAAVTSALTIAVAVIHASLDPLLLVLLFCVTPPVTAAAPNTAAAVAAAITTLSLLPSLLAADGFVLRNISHIYSMQTPLINLALNAMSSSHPSQRFKPSLPLSLMRILPTDS